MSDAETLRIGQPYLGPRSYALKDRDRLFGRDPDAARLRDVLEGSPVSLLHAKSGAGKSSFINARLIGDLERSGWIAVRSRPESSPTEEVRQAALMRLAPDAEEEANAIDLFLKHFGPGLGGEPPLGLTSTLLECKRAFGQIREKVRSGSSPQGAVAIDEILTSRTKARRAEEGSLNVFQRFLDAFRGAGLLVDHIWMFAKRRPLPLDILGMTEEPSSRHQLIDGLRDCSLGQLRDFFLSDPYAKQMTEFRQRFGGGLPLPEFFRGIHDELLVHLDGPKIFLLLDQFEENYTRAEPAARRKQLIEELSELIDSSLQINILLSMRDEHVAELDDLGTLGPRMKRYRLHPVVDRDLLDIIRGPAMQFGGAVTDDALSDLVTAFTRRDTGVELTEIQLAMDYLWNSAGPTREITAWQITETGGVAAILDGYLDRVLEDLGDTIALFEALSLMEPLVTRSGRRNIVLEEELLDAPEANLALRRKVLDRLVESDILKRGRQYSGSGEYVEITHEFLIHPTIRAIEQRLRRDPELSALSHGLRLLATLTPHAIRTSRVSLLPDEAFRALNQHRERFPLLSAAGPEIDADDPADDFRRERRARAAEIMFRSAVQLGQKRERWDHWRSIIESSPAEMRNDIDRAVSLRTPLQLVEVESLPDFLARKKQLTSDDRQFLIETILETPGLAYEKTRDLVRRLVHDIPAA